MRIITHRLNECAVETDVFNCLTLHMLLVYSYNFQFMWFLEGIDEFTAVILAFNVSVYIAIMNTCNFVSSSFYRPFVNK